MYSSRAGAKLEFALSQFNVSVDNLTCADLGCSTGGFTDCLLQHGAAKVYAVDTGYGVLDYKLRKSPKVVVMERTNAMHVVLPELVDLVTVDVSWTPQKLILPHAKSLLKPEGFIISLIKPHYEAKNPYLSPEASLEVAENIKQDIKNSGFKIIGFIPSPILGEKGGNTEFLIYLKMIY